MLSIVNLTLGNGVAAKSYFKLLLLIIRSV